MQNARAEAIELLDRMSEGLNRAAGGSRFEVIPGGLDTIHRARGREPGVGVSVAPRYDLTQGRVGALAIQPRYVSGPAQMTQAPDAGQRPFEYSPQEYFAGDISLMGLGATLIPGSSTGTSLPAIKPTRNFKVMGQYFASNVQNLLILAANIAGTNIFASQDGVPIEIFSEVSLLKPLDWPTLDPAIGIQYVVANLSATAQFFKGALYGVQVRN